MFSSCIIYASLIFTCVYLTRGTDIDIALDELELDSDQDERIWRGKDASLGQFPYQALLIMKTLDGESAACGGSLVSESYVLTAAHCCDGVNNTTVLLGFAKQSELDSAQRFLVQNSDIIPHENYSSRTLANDICLLKLPNPANLNSNVSTIALPTKVNSNPSQYNWHMATLSGWGQTNSLEGLHSRLKWSNVRIDSHLLCQLNYFFINSVSNSQLCSSKIPWTGPCHGDSGGPLTVFDSSKKPVEIGIVSWGVGLCSSFNPAVYTYVPYFIDWINNHMK